MRYLTGEIKVLALEVRSKAHAGIKKFSMLETKLAPGNRWEGGGKETSEDETLGIWIKVFVGEILATEVSKPDNLMRKESWPTSKSR